LLKKQKKQAAVEAEKALDDAEQKRNESEVQQQISIFQASYHSITTETIVTCAIGITQAVFHIKKHAIDYDIDKIIGTDKTIFAIYGPNPGKAYGNIHVILKNAIKWHPNFYVTPHAATNFYDRNRHRKAKISRPWGEDCGPEEWKAGPGKENFHQSKFHPIAPDTFYALALDLIARVGGKKNSDWSDVTLEDVKEWWETEDSHRVIEAHLPYQVPLSYVECIVLDKTTWKSFTPEQKLLTRKILGKPNIIITDDEIEALEMASMQCDKPDPDNYEGFCFVIRPDKIAGHETFVPLRLSPGSSNKKTMLAFEAIGQFVLCLCDQEEVSKRSAAVSIVVDTFRGCSIADRSPLAAISDLSDINRVLSFNAGLAPTSKIHYQITIDSELNTVTLSHYGSSELYCSSPPLSFKSSFPVQDLCFFSFTVNGDRPVELYNVRTLLEPIPSVLRPQALPETHKPSLLADYGDSFISKGSNFSIEDQLEDEDSFDFSALDGVVISPQRTSRRGSELLLSTDIVTNSSPTASQGGTSVTELIETAKRVSQDFQKKLQYNSAIQEWENVWSKSVDSNATTMEQKFLILDNLSGLLQFCGLYKQALAYVSLIPLESLNTDSQFHTLRLRAELWRSTREYTKLIQFHEQMLRDPDNMFGLTNKGTVLKDLGQIYLLNKQKKEANQAFQDCIAWHEANNGHEHPEVITCLREQACICESPQQAERLFDQAIQLCHASFLTFHCETASCYKVLGDWRHAQGYPSDEADEPYHTAILQYKGVLEANPVDRDIVLIEIGNIYRLLGHEDQAREKYSEAVAIRFSIYPSEHHLIEEIRNLLRSVGGREF